MSNQFTNPRNDSELTYSLGSDIEITWEADFDRVSLGIYHFKRTQIDYMLASDFLPGCNNVTNNNSYHWSVGEISNSDGSSSVEIKSDISNKFFFLAISKPGEHRPAFSSNIFRIVDQISASTGATVSSSSSSAFTGTPTSLSSVLASPVITSSSSASIFIDFTQSPTPKSSTAITNYSGMSRSAKARIGVGIGIGIPLLLAMGIYLVWKFCGCRITSGGSKDSQHAAVDSSLFIGASNFQRASPQLLGPRMTNLQSPRRVPQELEGSRQNEIHPAPIYQLA